MARTPSHDLSGRSHGHVFDRGSREGERRTWIVVAITAATMVAEIAGGWITGSMALLADGWHMGTHVAALAIAAFAYRFARRWSGDERFAFGTWKVEVLGAFSSALVLGIVAIAIAAESVLRLARPTPIDFETALWVAAIGLAVNLASAWILGGASHAGHGHDHHHSADHDDHPADHRHDDLNLRSAYAHVLTDAFTSILAIVALLAGLLAGWNWVDPVMGIVGAVVIAWWAKGLLRDSARVLLDREMDTPLVGQVRGAIESDGDAQVADLHVWRVGRERYACIVSIVADRPLAPDAYRARLAPIPAIAHATIEVNACRAAGTAGCAPDAERADLRGDAREAAALEEAVVAPREVLAFWFGGEPGPARPEWFRKDEAFDERIRERFGKLHAQAARGGLVAWEREPAAALALVIVLDQFSRNLHRGDARAFAQDARALRVAQAMVAQGWDRERAPVERQFIYLPFEHAEDIGMQERSMALFGELEAFPETRGLTEWAEKHRAIIARFGRFPHRNAALGRTSTPEEIAFLREPGSSF